MFLKFTDKGFVSPVEGVFIQPLAHGDQTQLMRFHLTAGHELPRHAHPNEQTGFLISGRISLVVGDEEYEVGPGDSWSIPGGVLF